MNIKKEFNTSKLYYGFPVFVLGYKDENFGYNITTCSSSYSLGDMVVVGMFSGSNAVEQIKKHQEFSLNIPTENQGYLMEKSGFLTRRDKLSTLDIDYRVADKVDAPLITEFPISMECKVEEVVVFDGYYNFVARIHKRWVDESLLDEKGNFINQDFHPLEYMGDGKQRVYRYLDTKRFDKLGNFIKRKRKD